MHASKRGGGGGKAEMTLVKFRIFHGFFFFFFFFFSIFHGLKFYHRIILTIDRGANSRRLSWSGPQRGANHIVPLLQVCHLISRFHIPFCVTQQRTIQPQMVIVKYSNS